MDRDNYGPEHEYPDVDDEGPTYIHDRHGRDAQERSEDFYSDLGGPFESLDD